MQMSRRSNKDQHGENDRGLRPTAGKKGGEVAAHGHGPSTRENRETGNDGGKEKDKRKED
jgi:hypothetical protein